MVVHGEMIPSKTIILFVDAHCRGFPQTWTIIVSELYFAAHTLLKSLELKITIFSIVSLFIMVQKIDALFESHTLLIDVFFCKM